jgi:hypothetical protein
MAYDVVARQNQTSPKVGNRALWPTLCSISRIHSREKPRMMVCRYVQSSETFYCFSSEFNRFASCDDFFQAPSGQRSAIDRDGDGCCIYEHLISASRALITSTRARSASLSAPKGGQQLFGNARFPRSVSKQTPLLAKIALRACQSCSHETSGARRFVFCGSNCCWLRSPLPVIPGISFAAISGVVQIAEQNIISSRKARDWIWRA